MPISLTYNGKPLLIALCSVLFALSSILNGPYLKAEITGDCSNCHTMHNSQRGISEVQIYSEGILLTNQPSPQPNLLKAECIACHAGATGQVNSFNAPIVVHTTNPNGQGAGLTLAGGDFYWVATGLGATDFLGHNVAGIANPDVAIGLTPLGWDPTATPGALPNDGQINGGAQTWSTQNQLTCDGVNGCHGMHTNDGITGAHHNNIGLTQTRAENPTTIGRSYRFLGGINGLEQINWNWDETPSSHNEYFGLLTGNANYSIKTTISYSCAQCHGFFHSQIGDIQTGSPWLRHPTDIALPAIGEYANYNPDAAGVYSLEAPVCRTSVPIDFSNSSTVIPGQDCVMCLSCHRAHGSPHFKIMRWDYKSTNLSEALSGCNVCHTSKN